MVRSYPRPVPYLLAALVCGALLALPPFAGSAAADQFGARDRPVFGPVPEPGPIPAPVETEWRLLSALDRATVEEQCPDCCRLPGGLDHIANGGGARNEGHTTIELRGAPPKAVAVAATLYVGVIEPTPPPRIVVSFEGHPVMMSLLGTSADPCWGGGLYALYFADVLPFIPPWINGDYQVAGIPSFRSDGADPWRVLDNTTPLAEGTSLVLVYSHAEVPSNSIVYTHAGPSTFLGGTITINHPLIPPLPGTSYLRHTRLGGDGQKGFSVTPQAAIANDTTAINGFQIKGVGAPDNQDSDWNGDDASRLNQLWDTQTTQIEQYIPAGLPMNPGDAAYKVGYASPADCVSPSVHVLTSF